MSETINLKIND